MDRPVSVKPFTTLYNCKKKGICLTQSMEKESQFMVNPDSIIIFNSIEDKKKIKNIRKKINLQFQIIIESPPPNDETNNVDAAYTYLSKLLNQTFTTRREFLMYYKNQIELIQKDGYLTNIDTSQTKQILSHVKQRAATYEYITNIKLAEIPCTCVNSTNKKKSTFLQILPTGVNTGKVILYNTCQRTLFAAFKRQLKSTPKPDVQLIKEFIEFSKNFIDKHIKDKLQNFDYSYNNWYNHLTQGKQKKMDSLNIQKEILKYKGVTYDLMCKKEIQQDGGKNRAISQIQDFIKYVMGPVCWELEAWFTKYFPGYCGNKSAEQLEEFLEQSYNEGYINSLQGDGSAFDLSQHRECKEIDKYIYQLIYDKIYHVPQDLFRKIVESDTRKLDASCYINKAKKKLYSSLITGTVFSGSSDTTLMNTIRMALYNHFTLYKAGLENEIDYKLKAKGDDFMILLRKTHKIKEIKEKYEEIWAMKSPEYDPMKPEDNYHPKGIGQILKFLKIGEFITLDFCSNFVLPYKENNVQKFKILRRPERMIELAHYSRKALHYKPSQLKQYYLDLALALQITSGDIPFYRNYIQAYNKCASEIDAIPELPKSGIGKRTLPPDGHKSIQENEKQTFWFNRFSRYDMHYSVLSRMSTRKPPEEDVYQALLYGYGLSKAVIEKHRILLQNPDRLYDPISHLIIKD